MDQHAELNQLLLQLEAEMRAWSLWSATPPSAAALQSTQPFCIDTLSFWEWVQWLMLPRFKQMINLKQRLPQGSNITPIAEEVIQNAKIKNEKLIEYFTALDQLLSKSQ